MTPDTERGQAGFLAALECHDPAERAAVLDAQCSGDAELRRRVKALLRAHDEFNSFLNDPVVVTANSAGRHRVSSGYLSRFRSR